MQVEDSAIEYDDGGFGACDGGGVDADVREEEFPDFLKVTAIQGRLVVTIAMSETCSGVGVG